MGASAIVKALRRGASGPELIADWKWRPVEDVRADVGGMREVPSYIADNYGQFMREQAERAKKGDLGPRDLVKAYTITRSSVNRGARNMADDIASGSTRPEGYFAEWLMTPSGRQYLDAAQKGEVATDSVNDLVRRFGTFGMANTLGQDMIWAAQNLPQRSAALGADVLGSPEQWRSTVQQLRGIGPAKSGFLASMVGRGDMPTLDARQIKLQTGSSPKEAAAWMSKGGGRAGDAAVDRLAERQLALGLDLDPKLAPHYQHLTHHALWDKLGGTQTTHADIVRAMQRGAATPGAMLAAGGGAVAAQALINALREEENR
jgi:hypothetical protein